MTSQDKNQEDRNDLMTAAALQDSLLQSYRSFQLTLQSILIAVGTGLSITLYSFGSRLAIGLFASVQGILTLISVSALFSIKRIIIQRGKDVNFWHREVIKREFDLPPNKRKFVDFKIHQQHHRADLDHIQKLISTPEVSGEEANQVARSLVSTGLGHTRQRIDSWLSWSLFFIWMTLLSVSVVRVIMVFGS